MSIVSASAQPRPRPPSIGILGGVGAIASARFHLDLVTEWAKVHDAKTDDDFPRILHYSQSLHLAATGLVDNQKTGQVLRETLLEMLREVDEIAIICNSVTSVSPRDYRLLTPVAACHEALKGVRRAWLLASESTIRDRIYQDAYPHVEWMIPKVSLTPAIQTSITGGFDLAMQLPDEDYVVLGCTELSTQAFIHPKAISPTDEMIRILCNTSL